MLPRVTSLNPLNNPTSLESSLFPFCPSSCSWCTTEQDHSPGAYAQGPHPSPRACALPTSPRKPCKVHCHLCTGCCFQAGTALDQPRSPLPGTLSTPMQQTLCRGPLHSERESAPSRGRPGLKWYREQHSVAPRIEPPRFLTSGFAF